MRKNAITLFLMLALIPAIALTANGDQHEGRQGYGQSYESCGLITGEYLTEKAQSRVDRLSTELKRCLAALP